MLSSNNLFKDINSLQSEFDVVRKAAAAEGDAYKKAQTELKVFENKISNLHDKVACAQRYLLSETFCGSKSAERGLG